MAVVTPDLGQSVTIEEKVEPKRMLEVGVTVDGRTKVLINSSSLSIIQECLRKARYELHEKWRPENEHPATLFGSSVHAALEVFYLTEPKDRYLPKLNKLEEMVYQDSVTGEGSDPMLKMVRAFITKAKPLSMLPDTDKRSVINGVWILHEYIKAFKDDPYVAYYDEKGPFIERSFEMNLWQDDSLVVDIFGTIDFAFRHTKSGEIIIGDHKTSSALSFGESSYFDRDRPNHQYTCYTLGARKVFGLDVKNFLVSIVEVKAKPKTERGKGPSFPRQLTTRTEEDFDEFKETVVYYVQRYLEARETEVWPLGHVGSCNAYGACRFKQVCAAPQSMRKNILKSKFTGGVSEA